MEQIKRINRELKYNGKILFSAGERPYLSYKAAKQSSPERLQNIKFVSIY